MSESVNQELELRTLQADEEEISMKDANEQVVTVDDFDQDKDADFSNIKLGGRHFLVKAPKKETESGILLSDSTRKQVQDVQDMPTFKENIVVAHKSEKCELVEVGDMILLSPHFHPLELVEDNILYIMIHEDYVLATKKRG